MILKNILFCILFCSVSTLSAQHTITIRETGRPSINNIEVIHDNCVGGASAIFIEAEGEHLEYIINDDIVSPVPFFNNLEVGHYFVEVRNTDLGCTSSNSQQVEIESLCEVCGDSEGLDEDRDGAVNCQDTDCQPIISDVVVQSDVCNRGQGSITITASGENLIYDLNGVANSNPIRTGLGAGTYTLSVFNSFTYCQVDYPVDIIIPYTCEILGNGIDDDGDGDTDCEDSEHGVTIRVFYPANASCPDESGVVLYDGELYTEAQGENLEFRLQGSYLDVSGASQAYDKLQTDGQFDMLYPGDYTLTVRNTISNCTDSRDLVILRECEICDNDIDDDGDGDMSCDDLDCMTQRFLNVGKETELATKSFNECELLSEEEIVIRNGRKRSEKVENDHFDIADIGTPCGADFFYLSIRGDFIDPTKVKSVDFVKPGTELYSELKYLVSGITLNDGSYYKAVISPGSLYLPYSSWVSVEGYYLANRVTGVFDDTRTELSEDIYYDADNANIMLGLHSGNSCILNLYCLPDWQKYAPEYVQAARPLLQTKLREALTEVNTKPQQVNTCASTLPDEELNDLLIFVSGYRLGKSIENYNQLTDEQHDAEDRALVNSNSVYHTDPFGYWNHNGSFISRLKPKSIVYMDGHLHIETSNHVGYLKFARSLLSGGLFLNDTDNPGGFQDRRDAGNVAGGRLLEMIDNGDIDIEIDENGVALQKIDIVCHSMGYAYALGVYDAILRSNLTISFDRFYILAPENAQSSNANLFLDDFKQVWQYGSRRERPNKLDNEDLAFWQDGVAPQRGVKGLRERGSEKDEYADSYGRAFIPKRRWLKRGFVKSHSEGNYEWIFNINAKNDRGYVDPK